MFCKNCGTPLSDDSKFCVVCGTKVEPIQPAAPVAPVAEQPVAPAAPVVPVIEQPVASAPVEPAKKKVKPLAIILPIVAVILVAAIVLGVVFLGGKDSSDDKESDKENTSSSVSGDDDDNAVNTDNEAPQNPQGYNKYNIRKETENNYYTEERRESVYDTKFNFCLEETHYSYGEVDYGYKYTLGNDGKIASYMITDDVDYYTIVFQYEKVDGKYISTGSAENSRGETVEIEIVYESDEKITVTKKIDGVIDERSAYYIDDNGYIVNETERGFFKTIDVYDGFNIVETKIYEKDEPEDAFQLKYNQICTYRKNGIPESVVMYEYGEKIMHSEIYEETDEKLVFKIYAVDGDQESLMEFGVDNGKLTYEKVYDQNQVLGAEVSFNEDGLPLESITYSDGEISYKIVYEYEKR